MDKLGQLVYNFTSEMLYKYKGVVETPSLGMIDDILTIQKCSTSTVRINAAVNAFIEEKKLTLSKKKCHRIHVEKKKSKANTKCMPLKIHDGQMNDSEQEKYLGDLLNSSGTIRKTVEEMKAKGVGIVSEIIATLEV